MAARGPKASRTYRICAAQGGDDGCGGKFPFDPEKLDVTRFLTCFDLFGPMVVQRFEVVRGLTLTEAWMKVGSLLNLLEAAVNPFDFEGNRIARAVDVSAYMGISPSTLRNRYTAGQPGFDPNFPRPVPLGPGKRSAKGWHTLTVKAYVNQSL